MCHAERHTANKGCMQAQQVCDPGPSAQQAQQRCTLFEQPVNGARLWTVIVLRLHQLQCSGQDFYCAMLGCFVWE